MMATQTQLVMNLNTLKKVTRTTSNWKLKSKAAADSSHG